MCREVSHRSVGEECCGRPLGRRAAIISSIRSDQGAFKPESLRLLGQAGFHLRRRPRGHARCTQKNGPKPGRRSKPERVWGLEILIFGASRQPAKPVVAIGQFSFDRRGWDAEGKATLGGTRKCLAGVEEVAGRSSDFLPQFSAFEVTEKNTHQIVWSSNS